MMNTKPPRIEGEIAVFDPTGQITDKFREATSQEAIAQRRDDNFKRGTEEAPEAVRHLARAGGPQAKAALDNALGEAPKLSVIALPQDASVPREKEPLKASAEGTGRRVALIVVQDDAVVKAAGKKSFGTYDLYVRPKLDDRIVDEIRAGMKEAIVDARVTAAGLDRATVEALTSIPRVRSVTVSQQGERRFDEELNILVPMALAILLLMSVMTAGQSLMTTAIEEKSNRVVEVLLSAISPMQLMTGKILGQMCVGLLVLSLYGAAGIVALFSFALLGLIDLSLLVYLLIFFLITYFVMGSLMGAIGAAVNELREAQALLTPVMVVMMLPWFLWLPITRNPNSTLSTVISLVPPVNGFAMLLRMASTTPPPMWQVWLSILVGVVSALAALWFAGKVFRIGLLMYGKPPNIATLIRWAWMA